MQSLLETTLNTRDLGGYMTSAGKMTKQNMLIRSDVMKYISAKDAELLRQKNIVTIIDVRGERDVLKSPNSLKDVEGFEYRNIPIEEGSGVPDSIEDVSRSYLQIAEAENIGQVFKMISQAPQGVLFHCTAGKDRTGVISAILLMLAGVNGEDIIRDYMITKECNEPRFALLRQNFPDLNMEIVIPKERYMKEFLKMFREKYDSVETYLYALGLSEDEIKRLVEKLI